MSTISDTLYDLPVLVKCLVLPAAFLSISCFIRLIANRLPGQSPPVFEGLPFIGGVLKFVQVRAVNAAAIAQQMTSTSLRCIVTQ